MFGECYKFQLRLNPSVLNKIVIYGIDFFSPKKEKCLLADISQQIFVKCQSDYVFWHCPAQ